VQLLGQAISVPSRDLAPANPAILDGVTDLTSLTYLNEPSILHGLRQRYQSDQIYTQAGPVLIAINPFRKVRQAN
jgi:myosin V